MSYQRAQRLKGAGLGRLMVNRIVAGQGVGKSIKSAISDKVVAKMTRIKEKFDPMNIAKAFGGRLGAYAMGKMTGRSEEDMSYFTGAGRRGKNSTHDANTKKNPMITKIAEGNTQKMKKGDGLADVLSKIYNLIKQDSADRIQHDEVQKNLLVDREKQRQKWHEDLIKALGGKSTLGKTVTVQKENPDLFDMIKGIVDKMFGGIKDILEFFTEFRRLGFFKNIFSILSKVGIFLASPIGLSLMAVATGIWAGSKFLSWLNSETPDFTVATPDGAQSVLQHGTPQQIKDLGGRAHLEDIIRNGQIRAREIESMPEGPAKKAAALAAGGIDQVLAVAADKKVYDVPTVSAAESADTVPPKPTGYFASGTEGMNNVKNWEAKYGKNYNDDGTRKKLAESPATPSAPAAVTASPTPAASSPVTQQMIINP